MARVVAVTWFPRTYINLFETYIGLEKVDLTKKGVEYAGKTVSFTIDGYKDYGDIVFTQGWNGLHYFSTELADEGLEAAADEFMKDMQVVLLEKILKVCHSVTYKSIVADMMPLDFHTIVLTKGQINASDYVTVPAGSFKVMYKPRDVYYGGTISYVIGTDDAGLLDILLYHAYVEVASDFIFNMMKAMIRLFHSAESIVGDVEDAKSLKEIKESLHEMEGIVDECSSRSGKMKHVVLNFKLKNEEFSGKALYAQEKALSDALGIAADFERLRDDGAYMDILWDDIMKTKMRNINRMLDLRLRLRNEKDAPEKKGWL